MTVSSIILRAPPPPLQLEEPSPFCWSKQNTVCVEVKIVEDNGEDQGGRRTRRRTARVSVRWVEEVDGNTHSSKPVLDAVHRAVVRLGPQVTPSAFFFFFHSAFMLPADIG